MQKLHPMLAALLLGVVLAAVSTVLAEFASNPPHGYRMDMKALPPAAQSIMSETPGIPITPEQWQRLDKVMLQSGGWPSGSHLLAASIMRSWYWFVALPLIALVVLRVKRRAISASVIALVASPSIAALALAFSGSRHAVLL